MDEMEKEKALRHRIEVLESHLEHKIRCYNFLQEVIISIIEGMRDQLGSVGTTLNMRSCMRIGKKMSEDEKLVGDVKVWTPEKIAEKLVHVVSNPEEQAEIIKASDEEIILRKHYCCYLKITDECPDFCVMTSGITKGFFEGIAGVCEVDIPKKLSAGDEYCEIIVRPVDKQS